MVLALVAAAAARALLRDDAPGPEVADAYVGSAACARCHAREAEAWRGSHHELAMQPATDATVLGDFSGATVTHRGVTSTFFRRDGGFYVRTDGPDGGISDFQVTFTFGVTPLQQVLVDFPDGRKQALGLAWDTRAWDTRARDAGGQRWFHLYPHEALRPGDRLHWTGVDQTWNSQCADCHSTNVRKGFDPDAGTFATTWSDVDVGCEACHGPGAAHLAWAGRPGPERARDAQAGLTVALDERRGVTWTRADGARHARRSRPRDSARELEVCARCHARRAQLTDAHAAGQPFTDTFRPASIEPGLYHPDGQQHDEVYTWGSFVQSRMHAHGVTCSDCHEPHSGQLRASGNALCAACHDPAAFDAPAHHHHAPASPGAACAACHLPPTTYMQLDARHDHSLRVPRPDRAAALGTPDACTTCHVGRPARWAADALATWFPTPRPGFQDFAEAFAGAERGDPSVRVALAAIATRADEPALVRASAVARLARWPGAATRPTLAAALADRDPMVRAAAVTALSRADAATRAALLAPRLDDPSRLVRTEAARALAGTAVTGPALERATAELLAALRFNAERPEAHVVLGNLAAERGAPDEARAAFSQALAIDPAFTEAAVNLADLHRGLGDEARAEAVLRAALSRVPEAAAAHHALGLSLVRQRRHAESLQALARASSLAPGEPRFAYVYAVALSELGQAADARRVLDDAVGRHPFDVELLRLAVEWRAAAGDRAGALAFARRLEAVDPGDPALRRLLDPDVQGR